MSLDAQGNSLSARQAEARDAGAVAAFNRAMALEAEGKSLIPDRVAAGVHPLLRDPSLGFHAVARHQGPGVARLMVTNAWSD